jgi:hypothetical protein
VTIKKFLNSFVRALASENPRPFGSGTGDHVLPCRYPLSLGNPTQYYTARARVSVDACTPNNKRARRTRERRNEGTVAGLLLEMYSGTRPEIFGEIVGETY